jgi:hypothetical protein
MGDKKEAVTLEFGKSREAGVSVHFTYVKHPYIAQSRDIQTNFIIKVATVDSCYCPCKAEGEYFNYQERCF